MAADFYRSSHGNYWLVDRKTLASARTLDLKYASPQELAWIAIWSANAIHKLAKRLSLRQQVTATAVLYLRRFYLKNSYCETDIPLVAAACVYVAAKAEEAALHIKVVVTEARATFNEYGLTNFPSDSTKLAEMEFYLIEDLEFHLIVYHPYRSLVHMTGRDSGPIAIRETMLDMEDNQLQVAWLLLNDTYRTELCLLYPPHMIAIAAIYLSSSLVSRPPVARQAASSTLPPESLARLVSSPPVSNPGTPGANSTPALHPSLPNKPGAPNINASTSTSTGRGKTDLITFLASLDVQMPIVLEIVQEMISLYACWKAYDDNPSSGSSAGSSNMPGEKGMPQDTAGGPRSPAITMGLGAGSRLNGNVPITPGDDAVIKLLARMRGNREMDLAHPANAGQPQ